MNAFSADQYLEAVDRKHQGSLPTLHNHHFLLQEDGKTYLYKKGTNAIVFKTESYSKLYAIRFFFYQEHELFRRYVQLQEYLNGKDLSWSLPFHILDKEYYPFVKMDWVEGISLGKYLDTIIHDPSAISDLQKKLLNLSKELEANGVGHGDLNPDHIHIAKDKSGIVLKLIDYDSMFIPAFKGKDSLRIGTSGFQHPMRLASDFSERIDRFSVWVFLTALEAFKTNPLLLSELRKNSRGKTAQFVFQFSDLAFPEQSSIFNELKSYNKEALNFYIDKLIGFCNTRSVDQVEAPQLFEEKNITPPKKEQAPPKPKETTIAIEKEKPSVVNEITGAEKKATQAIPVIQHSFVEKERHFIDPTKPWQPQGEIVAFQKQNKKSRVIFIVAGSVVLILTSIYFIKPQNKKVEIASQQPATAQKPPTVTLQQTPLSQPSAVKDPSVFTTTNIRNALTQLYQSYNQRNLNAILSNYADSLNEYYDASSVNKQSLEGILKNLFIKPYSYQCSPDWATLRLENENHNLCGVTITLNETIKTKKRSDEEKFTSLIEYTFDKNFKIVSEKRID